MADGLVICIKQTLPSDLGIVLNQHLANLELGRFEELLSLPLVRVLLGHAEDASTQNIRLEDFADWNDFVFRRLGILLSNRNNVSLSDSDTQSYRQHLFFLIAISALQAFIQSNVTGPPLPFLSSSLVFLEKIHKTQSSIEATRASLVKTLSVDGEAAYKLTPNIELLCLADTILTCPPIKKNIKFVDWATLRTNFLHQRLLSEISPTLQISVYDLLQSTDSLIGSQVFPENQQDISAQFLLEKAAIHTYFGLEKRTREDLDQAAKIRKFQFALTGFLGKRTKYQQEDISQLVVLARSYNSASPKEAQNQSNYSGHTNSTHGEAKVQPQNLDLNDDTLLEAISFAEISTPTIDFVNQAAIPPSLASLDPGNQPLLEPLDSILLLSLASSITNTSPTDGLTREETLPYAVRALEGGSSNWQIYTQALLVRSRTEGYKSRTVERGLLQLQALVDQIIVETSSPYETSGTTSNHENTSTFLPRPKFSESAPVAERLRYIYQLSSPTRWQMEAELAARWVSLGGLRSALDIYERLEMWAEAALCLAATDRDDKARKILRRQLFYSTNPSDKAINTDDEKWEGKVRDPQPADAPRLYCILGDLDRDIQMYERAWDVSNCRYARAQRSLGRYYFSANDYSKSAEAYSKALRINQTNGSTWFALGCSLLELSEFEKAAEAFSRTVQLDDTDAEAWSNLAAALLRKDTGSADPNGMSSDNSLSRSGIDNDPEIAIRHVDDPQKHKKDALKALKHAARLKYDNFRIWDNLLTIAASIVPPSYNDIVIAQKRIIDMRGLSVGEQCIDVDILEHLVRHVITVATDDLDVNGYDSKKPGLARMVVELVDKHVVSLITSSRRLWLIVAMLALWRVRPSSALEAHEKAWRAVTNQPNWDSGTEASWSEVVDATVDLADAYESLGSMDRTEGLAAGTGEPVAKDWRFKARSAIKGIVGKGKGSWEGTAGWKRLEDRLESLKRGT